MTPWWPTPRIFRGCSTCQHDFWSHWMLKDPGLPLLQASERTKKSLCYAYNDQCQLRLKLWSRKYIVYDFPFCRYSVWVISVIFIIRPVLTIGRIIGIVVIKIKSKPLLNIYDLLLSFNTDEEPPPTLCVWNCLTVVKIVIRFLGLVDFKWIEFQFQICICITLRILS